MSDEENTNTVAEETTATSDVKENKDELSDGWSSDEDEAKSSSILTKIMTKRQHKKDKKEEIARMYARGNFKETICGVVDVKLMVGQKLAVNKKTGKGVGGKGFLVKMKATWPSQAPSYTSELAITEDDEINLFWRYAFPSLVVFKKMGNVKNNFFKFPALVFTLKEKTMVRTRTVAKGQLHLGSIIGDAVSKYEEAEKANSTIATTTTTTNNDDNNSNNSNDEQQTKEEEEEANNSNDDSDDNNNSDVEDNCQEEEENDMALGENEHAVAMLSSSGARKGDIVVKITFAAGKQEFRPLE